MPVSPDYAADLAKSLLGVYVAAEERLLQLIGANLARTLDAGPSWRETALRQVQRVRIDTERLVKLVDERGSAALTDAVWTAYNRGVALAGTDLASAGQAVSTAFGAVNTRGLTALVDTAKQTLGPSLLRIQSGAERMYADVVADTAALELAGTMTRRQAAAHSMRVWADRGVPGFVDKAGRAWSMSAYAEMTARTAAGQAMVAGHVDRLREAGNDLVMVSDAPEECALCRPWEGQVLSLSGATTEGVKASLATAIAAGLQHANCRHRLVLYIPGVTKRLKDTADPEGDALRQRQRAYERDIRKRKRRVAALDPIDKPTAALERRKLRAKQAEFKAWREQHGRKDLAYRTSISMPPAAPPTRAALPDGLPEQPPPVAEIRVPDAQPAKRTRTARPVPQDVLDRNTRELRAVPDDELEAALLRAFEAEAVSGDTLPATDRIMREIDRRQQAELKAAAAAEIRAEAARVRKENREREKWDQVQALIDDGMDPEDAVERITGVTVERQRRAALLARLRQEGYAGDQSLNALLRRKFNDDVYRRFIDAEEFTRGHMLTRQAEARGVDPLSLFVGPEAVARNRASEELRTYWDRHGRLTFEQFVDQQLNGGAAKRVVSDWVT